MNGKTFSILALILLIAIGIGIVVNGRKSIKSPQNIPPQTDTTEVQETGEENTPMSFRSLPSPVVAPVSDTVKEIGESMLVVTGVSGDMTLPIDPSVVKVFRREGDALTDVTLSTLKQGDRVQVNIVKPGELVHLILQ